MGYEYLLLEKCDRHGAELGSVQRREWNLEVKRRVVGLAGEKGMKRTNYKWREFWDDEEGEEGGGEEEE